MVKKEVAALAVDYSYDIHMYTHSCIQVRMCAYGYSYGYGYERAYFPYKDMCSNQ
jgi:hypothetical protein